MRGIRKFDALMGDASYVVYADYICDEIFLSARERGTGIARRTPEYLTEKILAGKAVIALTDDGKFAGLIRRILIYRNMAR